MKHELKIWPQYYDRVLSGEKTFEYRNNDRGFQKGDKVCLKCFDPEKQEYITDEKDQRSAWIFAEVGYVLPLQKGQFCVFSLLNVTTEGIWP